MDNDCDNAIDENLTKQCAKQKGVCQGAKLTCSNGQYGSCGASEYGPNYEQTERTCDGRDNDCDGITDENEFTKVFGGGQHTCAIDASGKAYCWGKNDKGQLGDGSTTDRQKPTAVGGSLSFRTMALGKKHTCGITTGDKLYCWGHDIDEQLGFYTSGDYETTPKQVSDVGARPAKYEDVAAGEKHTCGVSGQFEIWCWGTNVDGQCGQKPSSTGSNLLYYPEKATTSAKFKAVSAGSDALSCGLSTNDEVYCWGKNGSGQVGNGSSGSGQTVPTPTKVSSSQTFASVSAGNDHACALTSSGDAYCWGENSDGQLGLGSTADKTKPTKVSTSASFDSVRAGGTAGSALTDGFTCARTASGKTYCWGEDYYFANGDGDSSSADNRSPNPIAGGHKMSDIAAGGAHGCGVTDGGATYCWGRNSSGQLGRGATSTREATPAKLPCQ